MLQFRSFVPAPAGGFAFVTVCSLRAARLVVAGFLLTVPFLRADTLTEKFATNPMADGWRIFGANSLFHWNPTNQNLEVTWDSTQPNSYFYLPLGAVLTKADDFAFSFDLTLHDIAAGLTPDAPDALQVAVGLFNFAEATNTAFSRGKGGVGDLVEFDYFPAFVDPQWGPSPETIDPVIISRDVNYAFGFAELALTTNDLFHVQMGYTAATQTLVTQMTRNGAPFGPIGNIALSDAPGFTDFQVDSFSISSYAHFPGDANSPSDASSLLAHGVVANLAVTIPPAVGQIQGALSGGVYSVQFQSRANWLYTLETSADLQTWTPAAVPVNSAGGRLTLTAANTSVDRAFYRVRATKP